MVLVVSSNCGGRRGSVEYWIRAFGGESGSRAAGRAIVVGPTGALSSTSDRRQANGGTSTQLLNSYMCEPSRTERVVNVWRNVSNVLRNAASCARTDFGRRAALELGAAVVAVADVELRLNHGAGGRIARSAHQQLEGHQTGAHCCSCIHKRFS